MRISAIKKQITKEDVGKFAILPFSRIDHDEMSKLKSGKPLYVETKYFRTPIMVKLFNKYHAVCALIAEHTEDKTHDDIDDYLRLKTGLVDYMDVKNINGESIIRVKTKSIAWHKMTPDEFEIYWNKCVPIICKMLDCTEKELEDNLIF